MKKYSFILIIVFIAFAEQSNAQWSCCDTVSFENPTTKIVINSSPDNIWQIGKPDKTFFNTAHSGSKAIVTDTINSYPPDDTSSFVYTIHKPNLQTCITLISFWQKYDMDTIADKGIIDASYDGGNSWIALKDTNRNFQFHWFMDYHLATNNYTQHKLIISGRSDGWIKSEFFWQWYILVKSDTIISPPDSLLIRFTFISDSVTKNKEGWMIDDITINALNPINCEGSVHKFSKDYPISVFPNPMVSQATVQTPIFLENATLTVYNSLGRQTTRIQNITGKTITLYRNNLPPGLYYIQLTQDNLTIARGKIVIANE